VEDRSRAANPASQVPGVAAFSYFDLSGRWRVNDKVELRGGATNLTDEQPPIVGGTVGLTDRSTYDVLGRAFYVALRIRLD
jgi:outer membrane receptor protein involved in Fe transport